MDPQLITKLHQTFKQHPTLIEKPETLQLIRNILTNIQKNPLEDKYRTIKLVNPKFAERIVQVPGALDLLSHCGFRQTTEVVQLPLEAPWEIFTIVLTIIQGYEKRKEIPSMQNQPTTQFTLDESFSIRIEFRNEQHQVVDVIELPKRKYEGWETLETVVFPDMKNYLRQNHWAGFALYAQHEPVYKHTTMDDLNYQRKDQRLVLQCENHNCQYRAVLCPVVQTEECVVCLEPITRTTSHGGMCMHFCTCKSCGKMLDKCPLCRKRYNTNPMNQ